MTEYLAPGVYVEESAIGPRPIEGVPTSIAAFLGETERGPLRPRLIASYGEYVRWFGGTFAADRYVPHTAQGFFDNGGRELYVCRIVSENALSASRAFGAATLKAIGPGGWGNGIFASITDSTRIGDDGEPIGFRLRLAYWNSPPPGFTPFDPFLPDNVANVPAPAIVEDFDDLVADPASPDFYGTLIGDRMKSRSALVWLDDGGNPARPDNGDWGLLAGGADNGPVTAEDFGGATGGARDMEQGLAALALDTYRDVALVHAPYAGAIASDVARAIVAHCEQHRFRFAVLDCAPGQADPRLLNPRLDIGIDSAYAAYYYPWLVVQDPQSGSNVLVPPGGHVLGVYARTDAARGVFKAPANEIALGALGLEYQTSDSQQDEINVRGVNVIREFSGRGIRVWGARTLSSDPEWKYVSIRRLFIFIEHSIYEGTQWVVFEPNDEKLWARLKDSIRLFLRNQWREGALFGRTEQEAFFIICDRSTMTQDDISNGRLICVVGMAPVRPAEFIVLRISQLTRVCDSEPC